MRRTVLGELVVGVAAFAFLLGFVQGSLAPALVGLALLAFAAGAGREVVSADVKVERKLPPSAEVGSDIDVVLEARADPPMPITVRDGGPRTFRLLSREVLPLRGRATEQVRMRPLEPGLARWTHAEVSVADGWGLHEATRRVDLPGELRVLPEARWRTIGRIAGRRHTVETLAPSAQRLESGIEIDRVREFLPGDRVRDVDWPRTARLGHLFVREREQVAPRPVLILLEATGSMRERRRVAKLTTAARVAYGVAAAAEAAGVAATLTTFDEHTVTTARGGGGGRAVAQALRRLSSLEASVQVVNPQLARADPGVPMALPGALDAALGTLARGGPARPFVVAILDAESHPERAEAAASRLTSAGFDVVVVAPATGAHHWRRHEVQGALLPVLVEGRARRERLRHRLAARRVPLLTLKPGNEAVVVEEVARWAQ